jgi:polysaccharide pyruvyl transferase WcaK-like protein
VTLTSRDPRQPRVGILGRFGSGNLGNEASLEAVLNRIRATSSTIRLDAMCSGPGELARRWQMPAVSMHWLDRPRTIPGLSHRLSSPLLIASGAIVDALRTIRWVGRHDFVLVPGTGPLESTTYVRPWQTPWVLFWASVAGRITGTRVWYVCVGASRPNDPVTRWLLRGAAGLATYRSFRDQASRDAVAALGVDVSADPVFPDLVWSLPVPPATHRGQRADGRRAIGLGVMAYSPPSGTPALADGEERLLEGWANIIRKLLESGHTVRLFYGDDEDRQVIEQIRRSVPSPAVSCVDVSDTEGLMRELAGMDAVIATRFHNVLCALMCERPTVSVGYGRKHRDLMAEVGFADLALDLEDLAAGRLTEILPLLDRERASVAERLGSTRQEMRSALEPQFLEMLHQLGTEPAELASGAAS